MLRRGGLMMCGRGMLCPWGPKVDEWEPKGRAPGCRSRWQRRGAGRSQRAKRGHSPYSRPRALSLRPVNLMGNRAPGMRAPRNTNQFLMGEKYQLLKLRSDSVGTECSGGSDCEMDPLDMDSYLGVLENAHGALLEPQEDAEALTYCCSSDSSPLCASPKAYWSPFTSESGGQTWFHHPVVFFAGNNMERDLIEAYEDEITALQEEVRELKEMYKENQKEFEYLSSVNINKALLSYHSKVVSDPGQIKDSASVDLELDHCKKEIEFFNKISGIKFTKYFKKRAHKADNEVLYKHRLVGHCQSLTFQMEFESLDLTGKGGSCCDVTNLNIIMGSGEHSDLIDFVSRTEEKKNLLAFFRTLSNFADWGEYRRHTFVHFKEKYPSAVGLPVGFSGEYLVLRNPRLPGSELLLVWKIEIDEEGAVIPILDLLPKIPEQALALDKLGVIESAATGFKTLLQTCGIESSIENLIRVFCLPETDDNEQKRPKS